VFRLAGSGEIKATAENTGLAAAGPIGFPFRAESVWFSLDRREKSGFNLLGKAWERWWNVPMIRESRGRGVDPRLDGIIRLSCS